MKSSNKSSIITGTILLALAAVFSICLLLQLLDFGIGGPGHNNIFYYRRCKKREKMRGHVDLTIFR